MENEDKLKGAILGSGCISLAVAVILALAMMLMMCGCKTTEVVKEVPVITEHTTVQHHTDIVRDTLMMRDSIYHYVMGDTVIIERWHHTQHINNVVVADTVRDTIPQIVTVTTTEIKEINKLHWWQSALMWLGGILSVVGIFFIVTKMGLIRF